MQTNAAKFVGWRTMLAREPVVADGIRKARGRN